MGHEKHIRIRPYRSSEDLEQVRELFKIGLSYEPNPPVQVAYRTQLRGPIACLSYCGLLLGLLLATFLTNTRIRYVGIALCIAGCTLFVALYLPLSSAASDQASNRDLKEIVKTYGVSESIVNHNGNKVGGGRISSGFWVAEVFEKGWEKEDTEIIGFIGLGRVIPTIQIWKASNLRLTDTKNTLQ